MPIELMVVVERARGKYTTYCPEIPEVQGEGRTKIRALAALREAVVQLLDTRRETAIHSASLDAVFEMIRIE